jgi:Gas vesicle protein G
VGEHPVGLLTGLLTLPLAPVRGTIWVAERLLEEAERQLNDPETIEQQIVEAEEAHERGELTDEEFEQIEEELLERLLGQGGSHAG